MRNVNGGSSKRCADVLGGYEFIFKWGYLAVWQMKYDEPGWLFSVNARAFIDSGSKYVENQLLIWHSWTCMLNKQNMKHCPWCCWLETAFRVSSSPWTPMMCPLHSSWQDRALLHNERGNWQLPVQWAGSTSCSCRLHQHRWFMLHGYYYYLTP